MADKNHMVMAGLWDEWTDKKTGSGSRAAPSSPVQPNALDRHAPRSHAGHPRRRGLGRSGWVKYRRRTDELKALLVPFKDDALTMWPVNRQKVGNVRNLLGPRGLRHPSHSRRCPAA